MRLAVIHSIAILFPSDLEPWEESFEGIQFLNYALDTEVIVDSSTFQKYVVIACKNISGG